MRRVGLIVLIVFGVLATLALLVGSEGRAALQSKLIDAQPPPAPDYANPAAWAALPGREDAADRALVPGTTDQQASAAADVFFLHAGANWTLHWNAPIDHWLVAFLVDGSLMEQWASAFNGCCRVYAPRFRQEAIHLSEADKAGHARAVDIAYEDVRAAFIQYLANENAGRPIIIAGAQSGARHALRLLIDEFAGQPLRRQLVTAYVPGARIDAAMRAQLRDNPICDGPTEVGCVNVWDAAGRQAWGKVESRNGDACVNPLTWRADETYAPRELNRGTIDGRLWGESPIGFHAALIDAQCEQGRLWVTPPENQHIWQPLGAGDYHTQNYMFFFANIRLNAIERVRAFLSSHPALLSNAGRGAEAN